ncbi:Cilia- and flagella-associated protein 54 [Frankliniella fusca]|uniref:Cilia- and flagella-associated protein 54 n=1 Tax=Frankliniella fusca TaxID=407009 RepID=A0AAE1HMZ5_9NEOP|nr:Cilia- and flagella-associated protein 54 [Frankliniella fusca]
MNFIKLVSINIYYQHPPQNQMGQTTLTKQISMMKNTVMELERLHKAAIVMEVMNTNNVTDCPSLTIKTGKRTKASTDRDSNTKAWNDEASLEAKQIEPKIAALKERELLTTAAETP